MPHDTEHYHDGFSYERLILYITPGGKTNFGGELQNLLDIESGSASRISGQPTLPKWRDTIRKKLLKSTQTLLSRKSLSIEDRTALLGWLDHIESAPTAFELNHAVKGLWPIAQKVIARK